jgi:putative ABC transport system substrate-binding protein
MRRRDFILGAGVATLPIRLRAAQEPAKRVPRIGVLWSGEKHTGETYAKAFHDGLRALGYVEGQSILVDDRFVEKFDQFSAVAAELVQSGVDVLVASSTPTALAAKQVTATTPIVFAYATDPVALKLVDSLAHPGGNATGLSAMTFDVMPKQVELLNSAIANMRSLAVLYDPQIPSVQEMVEAYQQAASRLKLDVWTFRASSAEDLEATFRAVTENRPDGLIIAPSLVFYRERERIAVLALSQRLPTMGWLRDIAAAGVLMSYGTNEFDLYRRAAGYVDKILKGGKAADLPVEQPTQFHFALNARTAKALELVVPDKTLVLADELIN